jgi:hypothetical protein
MFIKCVDASTHVKYVKLLDGFIEELGVQYVA